MMINNKGARVGVLIATVALVIMVILAILEKTIPPILSWVFVGGLVLTFVGMAIALGSFIKDYDKR